MAESGFQRVSDKFKLTNHENKIRLQVSPKRLSFNSPTDSQNPKLAVVFPVQTSKHIQSNKPGIIKMLKGNNSTKESNKSTTAACKDEGSNVKVPAKKQNHQKVSFSLPFKPQLSGMSKKKMKSLEAVQKITSTENKRSAETRIEATKKQRTAMKSGKQRSKYPSNFPLDQSGTGSISPCPKASNSVKRESSPRIACDGYVEKQCNDKQDAIRINKISGKRKKNKAENVLKRTEQKSLCKERSKQKKNLNECKMAVSLMRANASPYLSNRESASNFPSMSPSTSSRQNIFADLQEDIEMSDVSVNLPSLDTLTDMQVDQPSADPESIYIVLDTNILISQLKFVDEIKDIPVGGKSLPHIYIPWTVIQELDRMKSRTCRQMRARVADAVKYIYTMLSSRHPRFHGQTGKMAASCLKSYDKCNDDSILGCCLQLQESLNTDNVILLTDDKNLGNKALISGVKSYTMDSIIKELTISPDHLVVNKNDSRNVQLCSIDGANMRKSVLNSDFQKELVPEKDIVLVTHDLSEEKSANEKELDFIMSESKVLLRHFLEPYLKEAIMEAYGDLGPRFLPQSCTLNDILNHFQKYWISVFSCNLPGSVLSDFQKLTREFSMSTGYSYDTNRALSILSSMEVICNAMLTASPKCHSDLEASLLRVHSLIEQVKMLRVNKSEYNSLDPISKDQNSNSVLAVFHHIWDIMNHLCGLAMDFVGKPHNFIYTKPPILPSKADFQNLLPNLYPGIYKIKKNFCKMLASSPDDSESIVRQLYDSLVHFAPSLRIQVAQPPLERFTVAELMQFCYNPDNKQLLENGYAQLEDFYFKLETCIHDPVWKQ